MSKLLREMAIELLDDDYGITMDAWNVLYQVLEQDDEESAQEFAEAVDCQDGRVYLGDEHGIEP